MILWSEVKFIYWLMKWNLNWRARDRIEGTIINLLFLVHANIVKICFQMFACTEIEGKMYLD